MRIKGIRTLAGPNIHHHKPVLVMTLSLEQQTEVSSHQVPGFVDRLLDLLPGLSHHRCSGGKPGGFAETLFKGTPVGHVVEHAALELSEGAGIPVHYGKTQDAWEPGHYHIIVRYLAEQGMRYLLSTAVELVGALIKGETFPLASRLEEARRIIADTELGPSTSAIVSAAEARGIPWVRVGNESLVQLGYGKNRKLIQAALTHQTSAIGVDVACDKEWTKAILTRASVPAPQGQTVETEQEAVAALEAMGGAVVVKPLDGRQGKGVSLNLKTPEEVRAAFQLASRYCRHVVIEELFEGRDYRVLVVDGKMVAASERFPCHVVGDGVRTISGLIEAVNQDPARGDGHESRLTRVVVDDLMLSCLERKGLTLEHVPRAGELVLLRETANLSTGGTAADVTDIVHPETALLCERAARLLCLDICGLDLIAHDIAAPLGKGNGIIEANAAPGLRMHHYPSRGQARDAAGAILDMLYPPGAQARIPIISITGTNGKTTVTRMVAHMLQQAGCRTGCTTTDGIYIDEKRIVKGDTTGPHSARTILSDPSVDVAVFETARGGIARRGLGYDWSDISVLINIKADHIGQDGITCIEDLVYIKSLVAERVREGGTLILNADDERLARLAEHPRVGAQKKRLVYFTLYDNHLLIRKSLDAGGTAFFVRDNWIVEAQGQTEHRISEVSLIPATMNGTAQFQVANALAAIAVCRAYGMSREQAAAGMKSFRNDEHNPGRANLYRVRGGYVMIDYGHNPDAFEAICRMASLWRGRRVTGIIGAPGDRDDSLIERAGRVVARGFHRIVIKEDQDLRGRAPGEVARILCDAIHDEVPERECVTVLDDTEAFRRELEALRDGDVIVMFYDQLEPTLELLRQAGAVSVENVSEIVPKFDVVSV